MTPDDRDLLVSLRRQQSELQQSLDRLNAQLLGLEARLGMEPLEAAHQNGAPVLPPLPIAAVLPPLPTPAALPPLPVAAGPASPPSAASFPPRPSLEFRFGFWLTRLGAVFGIIALALILATPGVQHVLGPHGLLAASGAASLLVFIVGERLARREGAGSLIFGRVLGAMALAGLYVTAYEAHYSPHLRVIDSPILAGLLLLLWSLYVLIIAERHRSQLLGLFALVLAYFSTAINPAGYFSLAADLLLAGTAVLFLVRNGWTVLSYLSMLATYGALARRLVVDENGQIVLDTSRTLHFLPYAVYLGAAWLMFTAGVVFTRARTFRRGRRFAYITLNNFVAAALLTLAVYIVGYDYGAMGWTLLLAGFVLLIMSRIAGFAEIEPGDAMAIYAAQGLTLFTAGVVMVFTGVWRALVLTIETFLLGVAAAFSADRVLTINTYFAGFLAAVFLLWEIALGGHHPWILGFGGALVLLINAWSSRGQVRNGPRERSAVVLSSICYCLLALALIFTALATRLNDSTLPAGLALAAMVLTFSIYFFSIYELPSLAQLLLIAAQALVLFPLETGEDLAWWSAPFVALITLLMTIWWTREHITRVGPWTTALILLYSLALAGMCYEAVRPWVDAQDWLVTASLLSLAFLFAGTLTRVWALAGAGQLFLALALYHFFCPPDPDVFPWKWWVAALPIVVLFATARAARAWSHFSREVSPIERRQLGLVSRGYQLVALIMVVRWVVGLVPGADQFAFFLLLGTLVLASSVRRWSSFGVRCSYVLSLVALLVYLHHLTEGATWINALAVLLLLAQGPLLRHEGRGLVTRPETWVLIAYSAIVGWIFATEWVAVRDAGAPATVGWAAYALFLFVFGLVVHDRRLRQGALVVVGVCILRLGALDLWTLSNGYRVLVFFLLAVVTLGIGYVILRRAERRAAP